VRRGWRGSNPRLLPQRSGVCADWEIDKDSFSGSSEDIEFLSVKQRINEALFLNEIVSSMEYIRELFSRIRLHYEGSSAAEPDPIVA
jgi:hypothetical protein